MPWHREELILALYLYCQIPFAKTKANNPEVIRLSKILGRTPASVARKLGNLGACDPSLLDRGVVGLSHMSRLDAEVWQDFAGRWDQLILEAQHLLFATGSTDPEEPVGESVVVRRPTVSVRRGTSAFVRVGQEWFRRAVLSSYREACCVCGLDVPSLLVAGHIIPWADQEATRLDPTNGLCVCSLHHKALDDGLMTVSPDFRIRLGDVLRASKSRLAACAFGEVESQAIALPDRFWPRPEYLSWHQANVFTP